MCSKPILSERSVHWWPFVGDGADDGTAVKAENVLVPAIVPGRGKRPIEWKAWLLR